MDGRKISRLDRLNNEDILAQWQKILVDGLPNKSSIPARAEIQNNLVRLKAWDRLPYSEVYW
jgi:hypothetical protein